MKHEYVTYRMPNTGCLLGVAYQREYAALDTTLKAQCLEISAAEYLVIRVIYHQEGLQLCEIGDILGKDKGSISRCISSLVRKGLIRTEAVSHKCLRAYITPRGEELRPAIMKVAALRHTALTGILSSEEIEQLNAILLKIINRKD